MSVVVQLPTFHPSQVRAWESYRARTTPHFALRCGRRWGKTDFFKAVAGSDAARSRSVGWFTPDYKRQTEAWNELSEILAPVRRTSSRTEGVFRTTTGGRVDFWTLGDGDAGRSRKYHRVLIDEAAFTTDAMTHAWQTSIEPTLLDYGGSALVASTPNGTNRENFFWRVCNEPEHGFTTFHAPTRDNPYMSAAAIEKLRATRPPLVFRQEYEAEFVDWSGKIFFDGAKLLVDGKPVPLPAGCDCVFATIDTAIKTGRANDGTAVTYWARNRYAGHPLVVMDWDLVQVEGASLEDWLPGVYARLAELAKATRARGNLGAFIEDRGSGTILLQQALRRGWPATAIDSGLTAVGKDERALSVSGYVHTGMVKWSEVAYARTVNFKGRDHNHQVDQVLSFRIGDRDAAKREDDLLDTFTYGISQALGDDAGY